MAQQLAFCASYVGYSSQEGVSHSAHSTTELYLIESESAALRQLTFDQKVRNFSWSPDGRHIAFLATHVGEKTREIYTLHVMDADGSHLRRLSEGAAEIQWSWSPDSQQIAFTSFQENSIVRAPQGALYLQHLAHNEAHQLSNELAFPVWSLTTSEIALLWIYEDYRIWVLDATGVHRRLLFQSALPLNMPDWAPDGQFLAVGVWSRSHWGSTYEDFDRLSLLEATSANPRLVFQGTWGGAQTWSPDSQRLAFTDFPCEVNQYGHFQPSAQEPGLYVLSRGETTSRRLADIQGDGRYTWSPDSQKIAFIHYVPRDETYLEYALSVIDVRSQQVHLLVKDQGLSGVRGHPDWPAWSSEGQQVAYLSYTEGKDHLYTVAVDGTNRRCLTKETPDTFHIRQLAWRPNST